MGSPFTITSVSNYNSNPPSDDGAQTAANRVQWSTGKQKLTDPIKTAFDASETATSNAFAKVVGGASITTTAVDYTVTASDQGKLVKCTVSGKTITTPDATAVGSPFVFFVLNASSGNITLAGNGAQTVDGVSSFTIPAGAGVMLNTDGSNWFTAGKNFFQAGSGIAFNTGTTPTTISAPIPGFLSGLELSTAGSSATFGIAVGAATDSTNAALMVLSSAYTKTTSAWAVGSGNGALDTGTIATSTWYHVWLIQRSDTGVVDVLVSTSASAPTMPTNYDRKRRIGAMKTNGSSQWTKFTQTHDKFIWDTSVTDVNNAVPTATRSNVALTVPTGIVVEAMCRASLNTSGAGGNIAILFTSLQESDQAPAVNGLCDLEVLAGGTPTLDSTNIRRLTNTSAQIGSRATAAGGTNTVTTYGWVDTRGK